MKALRWIGVPVGLGLAIYLIRQVGLEQIGRSLGLLRWGYVVVLVYPIVWMLLNTIGWRAALRKKFSHVPLLHMLGIRLAGETFNSLLPSGYVGGEPLKAKLLSERIPLREAASSVLIAKSAQSIALVTFVALGLTMGRVGERSPLQDPHTLGALAFLTVGISFFSWLLASRSFSRLGRTIVRVTKWRWVERHLPALAALDDSLGEFYREGKSQFFVSIFWHSAGWLAGACEVAVIFLLLGHSVTWTQAWFIGAMAQLAAVIGIVIPAGVGLYEGGHYMAATLLGLDPALGLTVSLIRRVREAFWNLIGVTLFWHFGRSGRKTSELMAELPKT
jgi:uncharacterized protein (TIRG00374 family)